MTEIHAIHGFLGLPTDWNLFNLTNLHAYDLNDPAIAPTSAGFWEWAKRFNEQVSPKNGVLLGYSLGGRLCMHALLDNPSKWKAAIIVSSHTGFKTEREKIARIQADSLWADRFEKEPWDQILKDWNEQPVFGGMDFVIPRLEEHFPREKRGHLLRVCSRGHQDDLSMAIQNTTVPILWICGQLDTSFQAAARELRFGHPFSQVEIVEGAAHRVPWEQPEKFLKLIQSFIKEVSLCL